MEENKNTLYIELGANLSSSHPVRNKIEEFKPEVIEEFRKQFNNTDVFTSVFKFDSKEIRKGNKLGPLYFDFDGELAKEDLLVVIKFLIDQKCPKDSVHIFYSGSKGFHLEIPWEALGIKSENRLNEVYKYVVGLIDREVHTSTIDIAIYDAVRLWRLPNSINSKSGLFKIPLTLDELDLPLEQIKQLAKTPRKDFQYPQLITWTKFNRLFQKARHKVLDIKHGGIFEPVEEGQRNYRTFERALKLKTEGRSFDEAVEICSEIEDEPKLSESEIRRTVASAYQDKYTVGKKDEEKNESQALQVVKIVSEGEANLFHDQFNVAHLAPFGDGRLIFKLGTKSSSNWLTHLYWKTTGSILNPTALNSINQMLEARARYEGSQYTLHIRIASHNGSVWYDLGDGRAVKANSNNWEIVDNPPILFRRFPHQKIQVEPKNNGNINELLEFVNLIKLDDGSLSPEQKLLLCWTVFSFIPDLPHPAPILAGPQGSNKSTFQKVLKELIDPSSVLAQTSPSGVNDFIQTSSHHWFLVLDNVSHLPEWLSDTICIVITGGGFSKRELYSDDADVIYDFKHIVGINGINLVVDKADLLDRSLIFNLKRTNKFTTEKVFWAKFEEREPYILGGIFDVLVKTLNQIANTPEPTEPFRMADFAHYGSVIAHALGFDSKDFIEAYKANISRQNQEALDASPVGVALLEFMSNRENWVGTPTDLLNELEKLTEQLHINPKHKLWPKDARWVWRRINEILPNLETENIKATQSRDKQRLITLQKTKGNDNIDDKVDEVFQAGADINDNTDNIFEEITNPNQEVSND